jgi:hypothetical protein
MITNLIPRLVISTSPAASHVHSSQQHAPSVPAQTPGVRKLGTQSESTTAVHAAKRNLRQTQRSAINMHLKIYRTIAGEKKLIPGYARNISEGGLAAFVPGHLSTDEWVQVEFTLPGTKTELTVKAIVRTADKFQYGLEFVKLEERVRQLIAQHCQAAT